MEGINAYKSINLPMSVSRVTADPISLDKDVDSFVEVEREEQSDIDEKCDLGDAWLS